LGSAQTSKDSSRLEKFNDYLGEEKAQALDMVVGCFDSFLKENFPEGDTYQEQVEDYLSYMMDEDNYRDSSWIYDTERAENAIRAFKRSKMLKEVWVYTTEQYLSSISGFARSITPSDSNWIREKVPKEIQNLIDQDTGKENAPEPDSAVLSDSLLESGVQPKRPPKYDSLTQREFDSIGTLKRADTTIHFNRKGKYLFGLAKCCLGSPFIKEYVKYKWGKGAMFDHHNFIRKLISDKGPYLKDPLVKRVLAIEYFYWFLALEAGEVGEREFQGDWVVSPEIHQGVSPLTMSDSLIGEYKQTIKENAGEQIVVSDSLIIGIDDTCYFPSYREWSSWSSSYFHGKYDMYPNVLGITRRMVNVLKIKCKGEEMMELVRINKDRYMMPYDGVFLNLRRKK
ncbi:MAG: hypothetical protein ABEH43_00285, partial [Flavobacteriales bacterium]